MASSEALLALEQSRLLHLAPGSPRPEYSFHHSLVQEVAYRSLLRRERQQLHATVGGVLETVHAGREQEIAAELAAHFDQAELYEKAFRYHLLAADYDLRFYAHHEALDHFDRALAISREEGTEEHQVLDVYLKRGRALELSGQHEQAIDNYSEMEERARELGRTEGELRARIQKAVLYCTGTPVVNPEKGVAIAQRALEQARQLGIRDVEARALWILLLVQQISIEHLGEAIEAGQRALELARGMDTPRLRGMISNDLGSAYGFLGHVEKSAEILAEARQMMEELDNQVMLANVVANQMIQRALAGKYHEALLLSEEGYTISERIGNLWGQACSLLYIDLVYAELGDFQRALEAGAQCLRLGEASGFMVPSVVSNATQAWIRGHLGLHEEGLMYIGNAPSSLHGPLASMAGQLLGVRALLHLDAGDLEAAEAALEKALQYTPLRADRLLHPSALFVSLAKANLHLAKNELTQVTEITEPTMEEMERFNYRLSAPDFGLVTGRAHAAAGDLGAAEWVLDEALATAEAMDSQRTLWRLLAVRADVHLAAGEKKLAQQRREAARTILRKIADNLAPMGLDDQFLAQSDVRDLMEA